MNINKQRKLYKYTYMWEVDFYLYPWWDLLYTVMTAWMVFCTDPLPDGLDQSVWGRASVSSFLEESDTNNTQNGPARWNLNLY